MKCNGLLFAAFMFLPFAMQADAESSNVVFGELDVTQNVDYWNTTAHVNPTVSQSSVSLETVPVAVSDADDCGDYLAEQSFDTRRFYASALSGTIRFTSEPSGLSVIIR